MRLEGEGNCARLSLQCCVNVPGSTGSPCKAHKEANHFCSSGSPFHDWAVLMAAELFILG